MTWEDVIDHYGLDVTWQGSQWRGPCPVHRGDNISAFVITPTKGFHCFACGVGGGLAAFLRLMGDEDGAAAIDVRSARERPEPAPEAPAVPLQPLDPTHRYFRERGIHETTARHFGMGFFRGRPPLGGRILIPLHDPAGVLVGHLGRAVDESRQPRYCFQRGVRRSEILFNLHRVRDAGSTSVIVVEGVFDAAAVHQLGYPNVVATLGCEVTENQRALLSSFARISVLFDDDDSGDAAAAKLEAEVGRGCSRLNLPKADPASIKGVLLNRLLRDALYR